MNGLELHKKIVASGLTPIQGGPKTVEFLYALIGNDRPQGTFIEFGTGSARSTVTLSSILDELGMDNPIITYDVRPGEGRKVQLAKYEGRDRITEHIQDIATIRLNQLPRPDFVLVDVHCEPAWAWLVEKFFPWCPSGIWVCVHDYLPGLEYRAEEEAYQWLDPENAKLTAYTEAIGIPLIRLSSLLTRPGDSGAVSRKPTHAFWRTP